MNILLTGSTGHIGQRIVRKLASKGHRLFLLVRPQSKKKAEEMFRDLSDIIFLEGDVEESDVVKNIYTVSSHLDAIECFVHLAAFYDLRASLSTAYIKNVIGTQNILHLMTKMKSLRHFHYFSTYAVNPVVQGAVSEDLLLNDDLPFPDEYARTKNHAEHLVRRHSLPGVKTIIHRPGVIIGDSKTGEMEKTDGPYYFFDFVQKLKMLKLVNSRIPFLPMPVQANSFLPILPVDVLADWSAQIICRPPQEEMRCYHLVPSPAVKTLDFLEDSLELLKLPLKILPVKHAKMISPLLPFLKIPKETAFYMNQQTVFDRSHLEQDYPELKCPPYQQYLPQIIKGYLRSRS